MSELNNQIQTINKKVDVCIHEWITKKNKDTHNHLSYYANYCMIYLQNMTWASSA